MHHLGVLGRHGERADTGIAEEIHDLRLLHPTNLPAHPAPHSVHVWEEAQMPKRRAIRRECHIVPGERPAIAWDRLVEEPTSTAFFIRPGNKLAIRSEEHTSELLSLMRISYAVICLKKKKP